MDDTTSKIKEGMVVRYNPEWCTEGERKLLHVVTENLVSPITGEMTRWRIRALNSVMAIPPVEDVEECMIEPTDFNVEDFMSENLEED